MPATFQLFDTTVSEVTPDVFGVWETRPALEEGAVSFGAPGEEAPGEIAVWSVNLSPDLELAEKQMEASAAQVAASRQGLTTARKRLDTLVANQRAEGEVSFSVSAEQPDLPPADSELLRALGQIQAHEEEVSYGIFDGVKQAIDKVVGKAATTMTGDPQAEEKLKAVMERMTASLIYYAAIETKIDSAIVARTQISWVADANTIWQLGTLPEQFALHQRTLKLAIDSRNALMRTFGLTAEAAVKLSVLLATPGGAIVALPAAWKYVNQILTEVGQYQALTKEKEKLRNG